ncbi:hypothetical protein EJ04DRAFT_526442 [Polyplosphaeria fusca]|uniref:Uncharacterized protein n=1 Tax=Polyplosphaeria fusca TaxID=682080 RepID=A0A9P4QT14_9PLEO|nr:hypothetical protein EJ04DRAFT_526442 [Polyplosphaeria fusca]
MTQSSVILAPELANVTVAYFQVLDGCAHGHELFRKVLSAAASWRWAAAQEGTWRATFAAARQHQAHDLYDLLQPHDPTNRPSLRACSCNQHEQTLTPPPTQAEPVDTSTRFHAYWLFSLSTSSTAAVRHLTFAIPPPNPPPPPPPSPSPAAPPKAHRKAVKLHKLRALRRKARLKGGLTSTGSNMSSTPLAVPASPSSSKRSRSRDSSQSAATSTASTPFLTPSASAPSLIIPQSSEAASNRETAPADPTPYPAFLQLSRPGRTDIHNKFVDLEWEQRKRLADSQNPDGDATSQWAKCGSDEVQNRNRYANVDPYRNNRVKLKVPEGYSDYINASPIVLERTKSGAVSNFIATQGPKGDSFSHIWRMIWNETKSPAVVIMLTQTHESGREKCFQYYPRSPSSPNLPVNPHDEFEDNFKHNVTLVNLTDDEDTRAQIRELDMTNEDGSETRKIWHLLFGAWPDFSVPEGADRAALLNLLAMSQAKNEDDAENPRIVHCSAGVGRSGTFIALDWLLQELADGSLDTVEDDQDPIVAVVETLRNQRMMMVQGEPQFTFLYDVIRERWRDRWIQLHPDEAEKLGVEAAPISDPRSNAGTDGADETMTEPEIVSTDEDMRSQLEAELASREMDFQTGK